MIPEYILHLCSQFNDLLNIWGVACLGVNNLGGVGVLGVRGSFVTYCLDKKAGKKTPDQRHKEMRMFLRRIGGEFRHEITEKGGSRSDLLNEIDKAPYSSDPWILIASGWEDIAHPKAARMLVENNIPVLLFPDTDDIMDFQFDESRYVFGGPIVDKTTATKFLLQSYLHGITSKISKESPFSLTNINSTKEAVEFASKIWTDIKNVALEDSERDQSKIAYTLTKRGFRSINGKPITQPLVSRYIKRAGKIDEWAALDLQIKLGIKL
ncbi:hypothetical protein [Magnetovibrio blakemorei]|uniref:Uncharacterized protein n=1 Tax=Magnetovibrio blakemorei TaxID=28181 RepID=A0A1E5Q4E0_9PROT|nr:hypothetical protein [Magnetovibrio blakemorei]OEJ64571.1 hypothetical protein BEN30_16210 [Magnetovibrio blakemorei]